MLNINLDAKDIESAVVEAILKASIGDALRKAIEKTLVDSGWNKQTVFQNAVNEVVANAVRDILRSDEWKAKIEAHVRAKLEAMPMDEICGKVLDRISEATYER